MKFYSAFIFALLTTVVIPPANASISDTSDIIQKQALQTAGNVADKLIRDTRFEFRLVQQKEELGMQVIDFGRIAVANQVCYAMRQANASTDTIVHFGVSGAGRITVWVNKKRVFQQSSSQLIVPKEFAYNRFSFGKGFDAAFKKGQNEILIRYETIKAQQAVLIRPQLPNGDLNTAISFSTSLPFSAWLLLGPFNKNDTAVLREAAILPYYTRAGKQYTWERPAQRLVPELLIDSTGTYRRDAYADWHYANGNTIWSVMNLAKQTGDPQYFDFIKKYTGFIVQHRNYFSKQYDSLFVLHGSFHRLFRMTMLDDAGAAVLPFIELYMADKNAALKKIIDPVAEYIFNRQLRLKDGTFCRPEPTEFTIWADDLFMSVPFLLRMAKITGQQKYYDDAAKQFVNFRKYLLDSSTGLYRHGWFSATNHQAPVCWGRANGWIAWASVELLTNLPASHHTYPFILASFKEQMATLVKYQTKDGMWRQVLDRDDSWEETSCTALFTLALAKGVRQGWIDGAYRANALNGWKGISKKIEADGTVHGICRGTEIGADAQYYLDRQRFDQDPRGLGAVITAGMEIALMK